MEKELKIAELASILGVSIPTTWNRIRKDGLKTVKKLDENRKEITYVIVSDDYAEKYINNVINNVNNVVNNGNYEDLLTVNNDNNVNNNPLNTQMQGLSAVEVFDRLTNINNRYNEELKTLNKDLVDAKSKLLLLEDKANREGFYVNEINELKKDNKKLSTCMTILIIFVLILLIVISFLSFNFSNLDLKTDKTPSIQTENN